MSFPRRNPKIFSLFDHLSLQIQSPIPEEGTSRVPGGETPGATSRGSLTVEAALVLSIFLFCVSALLTLFPAMQIHLVLRAAMEEVGEETAMLVSVLDQLEAEDSSVPSAWESALEELAASGLSAAYLKEQVIAQVGEDRLDASCIASGSSGLSFSGSSVLSEDDQVILAVSYEIEIPFLPGTFSTVSVCQRVCRRAWTGRDGAGDSDANSDDIVYVAENGTVYHESLSCTYLQLSVQLVSWDEVEDLRNEDGGKYYACERCASGVTASSVYITAQGDRYHTDRSCGSLTRNVTAVSRSEVTLPACSRCAGG